MTDIEAKALALVNEICLEKGVIPYAKLPNIEASEALCRAIERHEAFRQEVSDECIVLGFKPAPIGIGRFIIPAPKPDPLVALIEEFGWYRNVGEMQASLAARGLEIREKNDD